VLGVTAAEVNKAIPREKRKDGLAPKYQQIIEDKMARQMI
jgi:hypothetical protein